MENNIILTGPPRSGTTLTCFLINKIPNAVALHEPMSLHMFPDKPTGITSVHDFFISMRKMLLENREAFSKVSNGFIPSNPFSDQSGNSGRISIVKKEKVKFDKPLQPNFKLILKHNGHFTFLLPELLSFFPVFVILRNPVATIASWNSVSAPVSTGNLKVLNTIDPELSKYLDAVDNLTDRQAILLDKMYEKYQHVSPQNVILYEFIIESGGKCLDRIIPEASRLNETFTSKNENPLYDRRIVDNIKQSLLKINGGYLKYYSKDAIEKY